MVMIDLVTLVNKICFPIPSSCRGIRRLHPGSPAAWVATNGGTGEASLPEK